MIYRGSETIKSAKVYFLIMSSLTIVGGDGEGHPAGRPFVRCPYFARRDISVLSGWILMKLCINIGHVTGHCRTGF